MARDGRLTELEGAVLGWIRSDGEVTPYELRKFFEGSPSPHWSGSAGAIYPLVERLERRKLLVSRPHATGQRKSRLYSLTPAGERALAAWLSPPLGDDVLGIPPDPLRTRFPFLGVLPREEQIRFVSEAAAQLRRALREAEARLKLHMKEGLYMQLLARGAVSALKARAEWMALVERNVRKSKEALAPISSGPSRARPARPRRRSPRKG